MDSRVAYALAGMILGDQTSGRRRFAPELCPVVFSIDDGETSFVGAAAEASEQRAVAKSSRGGQQQPCRGDCGVSVLRAGARS
jgi:hypothetical protein